MDKFSSQGIKGRMLYIPLDEKGRVVGVQVKTNLKYRDEVINEVNNLIAVFEGEEYFILERRSYEDEIVYDLIKKHNFFKYVCSYFERNGTISQTIYEIIDAYYPHTKKLISDKQEFINFLKEHIVSRNMHVHSFSDPKEDFCKRLWKGKTFF